MRSVESCRRTLHSKRCIFGTGPLHDSRELLEWNLFLLVVRVDQVTVVVPLMQYYSAWVAARGAQDHLQVYHADATLAKCLATHVDATPSRDAPIKQSSQMSPMQFQRRQGPCLPGTWTTNSQLPIISTEIVRLAWAAL